MSAVFALHSFNGTHAEPESMAQDNSPMYSITKNEAWWATFRPFAENAIKQFFAASFLDGGKYVTFPRDGDDTLFLMAVPPGVAQSLRPKFGFAMGIGGQTVSVLQIPLLPPPYSQYAPKLIFMPYTEGSLSRKTKQEGREAGIAALNSTTLGQKLPEDIIRKVSEYGGRKRKTRKRTKRNHAV